jgi:TrmH family RNA methyltransferase
MKPQLDGEAIRSFNFKQFTLMISKAKIKQVRLLEMKKYRDESKLFVAEGNKLVADMIPFFECEWLIAHTSWIETQLTLTGFETLLRLGESGLNAKELIIAEKDDIRNISLLKNPQDVLAVFRQPTYPIEEVKPEENLVLALDGIQDPGNLGTIIRLADWFGIEYVVCSMDTADVFGPKAIQATMGALARVKVHYTNLEDFLTNRNVPLYGAFLNGNSIYEEKLSSNGIIIIGNEGNGIRPAIKSFVTDRLFIPNYPSTRQSSESLNAAIAAAIICAEFRRRMV